MKNAEQWVDKYAATDLALLDAGAIQEIQVEAMEGLRSVIADKLANWIAKTRLVLASETQEFRDSFMESLYELDLNYLAIYTP